MSVQSEITRLTGAVSSQTTLIGQISAAISGKTVPGGGSEPVIERKEITANGTYNAPSGVDGYNPVIVNVPTSGGKNVQFSGVTKNIKSTSMTATGSSITVAKTGTYKCTWMQFSQAAGSTSTNYSSQLYVAGSARGSSHYSQAYNNTAANAFVVTENDVSLTAGQTVEVRARSRGTSYYINAGMLCIEEQ